MINSSQKYPLTISHNVFVIDECSVLPFGDAFQAIVRVSYHEKPYKPVQNTDEHVCLIGPGE